MKVEVAVLGSRPYGFCRCKATLNNSTSTETVRTIRDRGDQDGHLDCRTAPELCAGLLRAVIFKWDARSCLHCVLGWRAGTDAPMHRIDH